MGRSQTGMDERVAFSVLEVHVQCRLLRRLYCLLLIQAAAGGPRVALRVVSLNAEATNRGPTFDMDLCELETPDGAPIPYDQARAYFKRDPAHRRAPTLFLPG